MNRREDALIFGVMWLVLVLVGAYFVAAFAGWLAQ